VEPYGDYAIRPGYSWLGWPEACFVSADLSGVESSSRTHFCRRSSRM